MIMPNVGVMQFMPVESFADPARGLAPDAKVDKLLEDILEERPSKAQITASWPQVYEAIRRGGLFVIEANTPAFRAMLRFDPDRPGVGDYEIHHQPRPHVERGRIEKVKPVAADERDGEPAAGRDRGDPGERRASGAGPQIGPGQPERAVRLAHQAVQVALARLGIDRRAAPGVNARR